MKVSRENFYLLFSNNVDFNLFSFFLRNYIELITDGGREIKNKEKRRKNIRLTDANITAKNGKDKE